MGLSEGRFRFLSARKIPIVAIDFIKVSISPISNLR